METRKVFLLIEEKKQAVLEIIPQLRDINVINEFGDSLLIKAIHSKNFKAAEALIKNNINVDLKDFNGQSSLHHCAYHHFYELAKLILEFQGDLSLTDTYGNQPLWTAVFNVKKDLKGLDIVELYLGNGADKYHKNHANMSPYDFATEVNFAPLLAIINKY